MRNDCDATVSVFLVDGAHTSDSEAHPSRPSIVHESSAWSEKKSRTVPRLVLKRATHESASRRPAPLAGLSDPDVGSTARKLRNMRIANPAARSLRMTYASTPAPAAATAIKGCTALSTPRPAA